MTHRRSLSNIGIANDYEISINRLTIEVKNGKNDTYGNNENGSNNISNIERHTGSFYISGNALQGTCVVSNEADCFNIPRKNVLGENKLGDSPKPVSEYAAESNPNQEKTLMYVISCKRILLKYSFSQKRN